MNAKKMSKNVGIYVHIPFCKQKCYYCDFISYENKENETKEYIYSLKKEIIYRMKEVNKEYVVKTIYIGGGTPSYIDSNYIREILDTVKTSVQIKEKAEITIEINPGTIDKNKIKDYYDMGINRISIGLQSSCNDLLNTIGRIHSYEEFLEGYNLSKEAGFKNINVDVMLGLPNQDIKQLECTLKNIISLDPTHVSIYSLILEENTRLYNMVTKGIVQISDEDLERKMYWTAKKMLEQSEYIQYEISNYSKKGYTSCHNTDCWKQKEYLGFGVAAHSYFKNKRFSNIEEIERYIDNVQNNEMNRNVILHEEQSEIDRKKEYMMLGLRLINGIDIDEFKNRYLDNPIYLFRKELDRLFKKGLIQINENNIKLTDKGIDLANMVWAEFI